MSRPPERISPTADKVAYVQALLEYTRDDARQVYLRVTAAFAVLTLFLTQLPFENLQALNRRWTNTLYLGLASVIGGAALYFLYVGATHHVRREIAKYLLQPDRVNSSVPDGLLTDVWRKRQLATFWLGGLLFFGGLTVLAVVLAKVISLPIVPKS
jgi:hypothetical protein